MRVAVAVLAVDLRIAIAAAGGVGRPNLEDPGNIEPNPPEPLQLNAVCGPTELKKPTIKQVNTKLISRVMIEKYQHHPNIK